MRICLVSREFAPYYGAGIGTYLASVTRALSRAGHEVHVLTADHKQLFAEAAEKYPGVTFHEVSLDGSPLGWQHYPNHMMAYAMAVYVELARLHDAHPFDYIEFPDYWGEGHFALRARRYQGRFQGAVMAVRLHTPSVDCRELNRHGWLNIDDAYLDHQEREALLDADLLFSPTRSLLERVRARVGGSQPDAVVPYPFYVDSVLEELGPANVVPAAGRRPEILYFGRLEHRKGVHVLIDAGLELLKRGLDFQIRLIGRDTSTGPMGRSMRDHLLKKIPDELRDRFVFEPGRPRNQLGRAIAQATVCCFPSIWENFPNVCLEAMSLGAPTVGSDAGGMAEIIEDGRSGLLFRSGDAWSLADALEKMLTDGNLRRSISDEAPRRIRSLCDPETVVRQTEEVIAAAAQKLERPAPPTKRSRKSKAPDVSIIVPYYNLGRFLPETLASIRAQTFSSYEVVIVDDGSTDPASIELLAKVEAEGGARVVRKRNGGLSSARNAGIAAATGKWILPLDPDDLIAPDFLEKTVATMRSDDQLAYATSMVLYFDEDPARYTGRWVPWGIERDMLSVANVAGTCTALMDREVVEDLGGYDEWLTSYEDWDLYCTMAERGMKGAVLPEYLFFYRWRPDSLSRTEVASRRHELRAYLLAKHPRLTVLPDRAERVLLAQQLETQEYLAVADRWNLKRMVEANKPMRFVKQNVPETLLGPVRRTMLRWFPQD